LAIGLALVEPIAHLAPLSQAARWPGLEVVAARDGIHGNLALVRSAGLLTLMRNGSPSFSFPDPESVEAATHLPLLAAPAVRRILLADGAVGGALAEALKHPVESLDYFESDPAAIPLVRPHLPAALAASLDDRRVRLLRGDLRSWLAAHPGRYDAVLLGSVEPGSALANRHATREFFQLVRAGLSDQGVASIALSGAPNYLSQELLTRNASVARAFGAAFQGMRVLQDNPLTLIGSAALAVDTDPTLVAARLNERGIRTRTLSPAVVRALLAPERAAGVQRQLAAARAPENRDAAPEAYFHHLRYRESAVDPAAAAWLTAVGGRLRWWAFALPGSLWFLALLPAAFRARVRRPAIFLATATTGGTAMALQFLVLFAWQSARGLLHPGLGILSGLFMAGLAAGGFAALRLLHHGAAAGRLLSRAEGLLTALPVLAGSAILAVLAAGAAAHTLAADALAASAAVLCGAAAGFEFPLIVPAAAGSRASPGMGGRCYALDLVGSAAGALLASLWLLPLLGLRAALLFFALIKAATWLLLFRDGRR